MKHDIVLLRELFFVLKRQNARFCPPNARLVQGNDDCWQTAKNQRTGQPGTINKTESK